MKTQLFLPAMLVSALTLQAQPAGVAAASPPQPVAPVAGPAPVRHARPATGGQVSGELTQFDLDFPGGRPQQLVSAIQKAMGRPLNAIVPDEFSDTGLPALKMNSVNVYQLFQALEQSSHKSQAVTTATYSGGGGGGGYSSYTIANLSYGFRPGPGNISDDTIWYFYVERPTFPPAYQAGKVCRFYSLAPYLDRHLTVDDITTAIETGWKMLGDSAPANISFHKDTKLLIAVGEPSKLETIDAVLKALDVTNQQKPASAASSPAPTEKPKPKNEE